MDAIYIARRADLDEDSLSAFDASCASFYEHREFFRDSGVRPTGFSLPRQHALLHYHHHIMQFGAPNGLCSSITESRHITAVKKPWRRSSRFNALGQMLKTNQRLDKLNAARARFVKLKMLPPSYLPTPKPIFHSVDEDDEGAVDEPVMSNVVLARTKGKH